jgi:hypothetical protein
VAGRIHTAVDPQQPSRPDAPGDLIGCEPEHVQLPAGNDTVLFRSQQSEQHVTWSIECGYFAY